MVIIVKIVILVTNAMQNHYTVKITINTTTAIAILTKRALIIIIIIITPELPLKNQEVDFFLCTNWTAPKLDSLSSTVLAIVSRVCKKTKVH